MRIQQQIFSFNGFSCRISVTDNSSSPYPKFVQTSSYDSSSSQIEYSVFLNLSLSISPSANNNNLDEKSNEHFTVSFFDMFELKNKLQYLLDMIMDGFHEETEHIDRGLILSVKKELVAPIVITNSTKKAQLGFLPIITYNRKADTYTPKVKVLINRDDIGINLPIDRLASILYALLNIDLHVYAINLINTAYTSKAYSKRLVTESQSNVTVK